MRNLKSKRVVIKIGTNTLTNESGFLDIETMKNLVSQIAAIKNKRDIVIITSGAIGAGMRELGLSEKPKDVVMKQVCAGIGQSILMANYYSLFSSHGIKIAQILLTYDDLASKKTYANLRNTLERLLELGAIPIINENDPISINEIGPSFGDNDNLSAMIASKIKADLLVILTNVEGLFDRNPDDKDAVMVKEVSRIDRKIESMGSGSSKLGIGGMNMKISAAKKAIQAGATVIIASGKAQDTLLRIIKNEDVGTIFHAKK